MRSKEAIEVFITSFLLPEYHAHYPDPGMRNKFDEIVDQAQKRWNEIEEWSQETIRQARRIQK